MYRISSRLRGLLSAAALLGLLGCGQTSDEARTGSSEVEDGPARTSGIGQMPVGYDRGNPDALATVIEFSDFGCPFCGLFAMETYPPLHEEFVQSGRVRWKYVPIVIGGFPNGAEAALAAECAGEQGRFWEMRERLYAEQERWKASTEAEPIWLEYAAAIELNTSEFDACFHGGTALERMRQANQLAAYLQVRGTPAFFIEDPRLSEPGIRFDGVPDPDRFREFLAELTAS